jgi:hypothetical protein
MEIIKITEIEKFENETEAFRTLNVWNFGPLADLEDDDNDEIQVLIAKNEGVTVAYLIAESTDLWHIETSSDAKNTGCARKLVEAAKIDFVNEVCSNQGVEFCEAMGLDYEDCR